MGLWEGVELIEKRRPGWGGGDLRHSASTSALPPPEPNPQNKSSLLLLLRLNISKKKTKNEKIRPHSRTPESPQPTRHRSFPWLGFHEN